MNSATAGTLSINRGGTGSNTLLSNQLLIGNGMNGIFQSTYLSLNNTTNTLSTTNLIASNNFGVGITNPSSSSFNLINFELKWFSFIGDHTNIGINVGNSDDNHKLIFDNTYTNQGSNKANK